MNVMKKKLGKNSGFTLVEMLIVVAIIAILIAVSIPLISSSLEKARHAVDDANKRDAIALATIAYLTDDLFATTYTGPGETATAGSGEGAVIVKYVKFGYSVSDNQQGSLKAPGDAKVISGQCTQQTTCTDWHNTQASGKKLYVYVASDGRVATSWDADYTADSALFGATTVE